VCTNDVVLHAWTSLLVTFHLQCKVGTVGFHLQHMQQRMMPTRNLQYPLSCLYSRRSGDCGWRDYRSAVQVCHSCHLASVIGWARRHNSILENEVCSSSHCIKVGSSSHCIKVGSQWIRLLATLSTVTGNEVFGSVLISPALLAPPNKQTNNVPRVFMHFGSFRWHCFWHIASHTSTCSYVSTSRQTDRGDPEDMSRGEKTEHLEQIWTLLTCLAQLRSVPSDRRRRRNQFGRDPSV
jgi:hypothetical protein